jgi:hypothetical protein
MAAPTVSDVRDVLAEIEQRADNATLGPWSAGDPYVWKLKSPWMKDGLWVAVHAGDDDLNVANISMDRPLSGEVPAQNDAEFIAHARTDVPRLVAALRAVLDYAERDQTSTRYIRAITDALGGGS